MLKAESGYLESGAPERPAPIRKSRVNPGKRKREKNLQNPQDTETAGEKEQKAEEERKKERRREKTERRGRAPGKECGEMLAKLYDPDSDSVAMNTSKNSKIFQDAQTEMWKLPLSYDRKRQEFQKS